MILFDRRVKNLRQGIVNMTNVILQLTTVNETVRFKFVLTNFADIHAAQHASGKLKKKHKCSTCIGRLIDENVHVSCLTNVIMSDVHQGGGLPLVPSIQPDGTYM